MPGTMARVADLILRYARAWSALIVLITAGAAAYLMVGGIRFDYNIENFFPAGDPGIEEYRDFASRYEPDDNIILIGFEQPDVFSYPVLRAIDDLTASLAEIPNVVRVTSLTNVESIVSTPEGIEQRRLIEHIADDGALLADQKERVLDDALAVGLVVNADATVTGIFIELDREANNYHDRAVILRGIREAVAPYDDRFAFRYSGIPYMRNTYVDSLQVEMIKFILISSLVIVMVLAWMFRTVRGVVMPLVITYMGVIWTIGAMMMLGAAIDVLSSTVATIILVVGIADSVHLLSKYYDGMAAGLDKRAAIREMIIRLGAATLLTSVTTAIGFGTLVSSNVVPMQRFGFYTAVGVVLTFVISLFLVSSILLWTRPPRQRQVERLGRGRAHVFLGRLDAWAFRNRHYTLAGSAVLVVVAAFGASTLRVNAFVNDDVGPQTTMYRDMVFFQDNLVSPIALEVLVTAEEEDTFKDPANLRRIAALQEFLGSRQEISRTSSVVDIVERLNRALHADSVAYHRLPETREETAQYLFLLELTDADLLERFVDFDFREARISSTIDDIGSYRMGGFLAELDSAAAAILHPQWQVTRTGTIILAANLSDYLTESLLLSLGLAFLFISAIMGVLFRNVKMVLISLVPNMLPLLVTAGIMGFAGIDIKPATAVIFSISFGIAVDDTIHYLARLRQESAAGLSLRESIRRTNLGTGKAIIFTSLILFGGFFVLVTSSFQSTTYLGFLVSATIFTAIFADLLLLPALLYWLKPKLARVGEKTGAAVG